MLALGTGFESADPLYWVREGYVVAQADIRGMHTSEGRGSHADGPGRKPTTPPSSNGRRPRNGATAGSGCSALPTLPCHSGVWQRCGPCP